MLGFKERLEEMELKYKELNQQLSDPEIISNQSEYQKLLKQHAKIKKIVDKYNEYKEVVKGIEDARALLESEEDDDIRELAELELAELEPDKERLEKELPVLCCPRIPMMRRTLLLRSGREPVVMKLASLLLTSSACIPVMLRAGAGRVKL